ncbi:hypothetical protein LCGC14_0502430 [marine sediment metagenome]|uniref:Uncharacterized protein n=2 Tax=root TaxID=1 RepID=A0A831QQ71_9FLAO|nr:hypothetical protein [Pricia sp.]HEA22854.1 hypothetical protein [Pricia antarctica]
METVLVFKTSVTKRNQVRRLRPLLNRTLNGCGEWNFDLEDCDNILRVESHKLTAMAICSIIRMHGFHCEEL